jgi:hypothetical protein
MRGKPPSSARPPARRSAVFTLALAAVVLVSGCSSHRNRAARLDEAARSLLPAHARVLLEERGDCVELALSPSCVQIYFVVDGVSLDKRVRAVDRRARTGSWDIRRKERLLGGVETRFRRDRMNAIVTLRTQYFRRAGCDRVRAKDCGDVVSVERG